MCDRGADGEQSGEGEDVGVRPQEDQHVPLRLRHQVQEPPCRGVHLLLLRPTVPKICTILLILTIYHIYKTACLFLNIWRNNMSGETGVPRQLRKEMFNLLQTRTCQ